VYKTSPPCGHEETSPVATCVYCEHWAKNSNGFREKLGGTPPAVAEVPREAASPVIVLLPLIDECRHQGEIIERCKWCGSDRRHVYACTIHGRCTRGDAERKTRTCNTCPDHEAAT